MKKVYDGKTKTVYELEDGNYLLQFKDDVTGEGDIIDPGANTVIGKVEGKGMLLRCQVLLRSAGGR